MIKRDKSATDQFLGMYPEFTAENTTRNVTFQVCEECTLRCTYCYQDHNAHSASKRMTFETGKKCVDLLFKMWEDDCPESFINKNTKMIVLDFIGGEPTVNIETIDFICTYFWRESIKRRSIWADTFMISISTNGTTHFSDQTQKFLKKWKSHLSYGVSIDGDKEIHDACRVYPDGHGSWEDATAAQKDYNKSHQQASSTKATICKETIPLINRVVKYFISQGYSQIHANYAYEPEYTIEDAKELYYQMKDLAAIQLENNGNVEVSLFTESFFKPKKEDDLGTWCGGNGKMLAFDTDGVAYPCVRYMRSSLGCNVEPIVIGDFNGIYNTETTCELYKKMSSITRRTESTDECFYCPVAEGCSECSAWNYQNAGELGVRCTNICHLHKARSLANCLYYNILYKQTNQNKYFHRYLSDDDALKYISREELDVIDSLEQFNKNKENSKCSNYIDINSSKKLLYTNTRFDD